MNILVETLALRLDNADKNRKPVLPFSETEDLASVETAYAVQARWSQMRLARGDKIVGRKIGMTSDVIRQQLGVSEADFGCLWDTTFFQATDGAVEIPANAFLQPRIEGEVAFLIGKPLRETGVTPAGVLAATDACALGVEIAASRIADWRVKLVDTVADNASYGGFTLGPWDRRMLDSDLGALAMTVHHNGALAAEGVGTAVLGHPANSVAWLANKLLEFDASLEPGDIVISGGITKAIPVRAGDRFVFNLTGQPSLAVSFM
jgi:2-keto-4-pentenoate hydratase